MNHGVRKFWILLLLNFMELLDFCFSVGLFPPFPMLFPDFCTVFMVWTCFFQPREEISGFLWNIPDILLKHPSQANSETKDELFNPS